MFSVHDRLTGLRSHGLLFSVVRSWCVPRSRLWQTMLQSTESLLRQSVGRCLEVTAGVTQVSMQWALFTIMYDRFFLSGI